MQLHIKKILFISVIFLHFFLCFAHCAASAAENSQTVRAPRDPSKGWIEPSRPTTVGKSILSMGNEVFPTGKRLPGDKELQAYVGKKFTLADCVDIALQNSPVTRSAWRAAKQAESKAKQSHYQYYPHFEVSFDTDFSRTITNEDISDGQKGVDAHITSGPQVAMTYLLLDAGGRSATVKNALAYLYKQNLLFNQSIQNVLLETETAYFNYYAALETLKSYERNVEETTRVLKIAMEEEKTGKAAKIDVHKTRARYEYEYSDYIQGQGYVQKEKAKLLKAMGLPAFLKISIEPPSEKDYLFLSEEEVIKLIEEGLGKRPEIAAMRASVVQKEYEVKIANSKLWPEINLVGGLSYDKYNFYRKPVNKLVDTQYRDVYDSELGFVVSWDIFDGFYNYYGKMAAKDALQEDREKLKQAEISVAAGVWSKYYIYRAAYEQIKHMEQVVEENRKVYEIVKDGYQSTKKYNILDLVYTQRDLFYAEWEIIQVRNQHYISFVEFMYEIGRLSADDKV
jgi:outer membrane protein TolC